MYHPRSGKVFLNNAHTVDYDWTDGASRIRDYNLNRNFERVYDSNKKTMIKKGQRRSDLEHLDASKVVRDRSSYAKIWYDAKNLSEEELAVEPGWFLMPKASVGRVVVNRNVYPEIMLNNVKHRECTEEEIVDAVVVQAYTNMRLKDNAVEGFITTTEGETSLVDATVVKRFTHNNDKESLMDYRWVVQHGRGYYWYQAKPHFDKLPMFGQKVMLRCVTHAHPKNVPCTAFLLADLKQMLSMSAFSVVPMEIGHGSHFEPFCCRGSMFSDQDVNKKMPIEMFKTDRAAYINLVNYLFKEKRERN